MEAGPGLQDREIRELIAWGSQLPIGVDSPVVEHLPARLTDHPHRPVRLVRGSVVGGSGAVNGGYFCRGLPADFARWGLPEWSWPQVLPHFRAIETDHDFNDASHGTDGPIPVQRCSEISGTAQRFIEAADEHGYPWVADMNAEDATLHGIGPVPLNILNGVRAGPGVAYLAPAITRPNLTMLTRTRAVRIRVAGERAVGVDAVGPEGAHRLTADRIVLCAGAISSAHLLMVSGIGDETVLRSAGIPVLASLPVGRQCTDHPEWVLPVDWRIDVNRSVLEVVLCTEGVEIRPYVGGFITMMGDHAAGHPLWPHIGVALLQPRARGCITVRTADPGVAPEIEQRYDSEPADVAELQRGAELARDLCSGFTTVGEAKWSTSQHLCGSAPMGPEGDDRAVVDPHCRVHGIEGLWVVDGSVMPAITSRGPHATIAMIAHRAAEFVRAG